MNNKKAKSIIRKMINSNNLLPQEIEALEISKMALERQITENIILQVDGFQCPNCGTIHELKMRNYCIKCGQKLKY